MQVYLHDMRCWLSLKQDSGWDALYTIKEMTTGTDVRPALSFVHMTWTMQEASGVQDAPCMPWQLLWRWAFALS